MKVIFKLGLCCLAFLVYEPLRANPTTEQLLSGQFAGLQQWIENRYRLIPTLSDSQRSLISNNQLRMHLRYLGGDFRLAITSIPDSALGEAFDSGINLNLIQQVIMLEVRRLDGLRSEPFWGGSIETAIEAV